MWKGFAVGIQVQYGMLARIAYQVRSIGKNFMSIGSTGNGEDLVGAIELELGQCFIPGDVSFARVVENDTFAVAWDF
jgi:hypothetical protein